MTDEALAPPLRRMAGETWAMRALGERAAEARFNRIARELKTAGTPRAVLELAERAPLDEARHFVLCGQAAERFGVAIPEVPLDIPWTVSGLPAPKRLLHEVVAMCCITETLSAAYLVEMQRQTTDPALHDVVREILTDEVDHSRLGWGHLAYARTQMDVTFLGECLPGMLVDTVGEALFAPPDPNDPATALGRFGVLDRPIRRTLFGPTMREVVFPGLAQHGIDGADGLRWLDARGS